MNRKSRTEIRKFITENFNDNELENLCFDYFPPVENDFTNGMTKSRKIRALINYSETRGRYQDLLAVLKREREAVYLESFEPKAEPVTKQIKKPKFTKLPTVRNPKQIFLSHSSKDTEFAQKLAGKLRERGWEVWIAPDSILSGEKWVEAINRGLEESTYFVLLITPNAVESRWVTMETNTAIALDARDQIQFVPLEVQQADTPVLWTAFQWIPFGSITIKNLQQLDNVLSREWFEDEKTASKLKTQPVPKAETPIVSQTTAPKVSLPMLFIAAEKAYEIGDVEEAQKQFEQICDLDQNGIWGRNAREEIKKIETAWAEIALKEERQIEYERIKVIVQQSTRVGQIAWEAFKQKFPDFDPYNIEKVLLPPQTKFMLPNPFAWVEIPNKGFSISKYPITNAQFGKFIEDAGYSTDNWWPKEGLKYRTDQSWSEPRFWHDEQWNGKDFPVVGVSWFEAVAFCKWMSEKAGAKIMLPTEKQWEYVAQGSDSRKYPWGREWDSSRCNNNVDKNGIGKTTSVIHYEGKGDSPFGVVDMCGNVWEWCLTDFEKKTRHGQVTAEFRVLRGGSWINDDEVTFAVSHHHGGFPYLRGNGFGFRVILFS